MLFAINYILSPFQDGNKDTTLYIKKLVFGLNPSEERITTH